MIINPYALSFINLSLSALLLSGVLFYRYVFPKKKVNLFILLILISLLPVWSIFRPGDYESGDFNIHIHRIMLFYDSLKEGIFMPSWAAELNATYGLPVFIFNYSLPYYIVSFFHFIGISFITSMKFFLGTTFVLSGFSMYLFTKKVTNNTIAALTGAVFYLYAPYHLIDVHFRATPGESLVYVISPLVFYFMLRYFEKNRLIFLLSISLTVFLLFMAHPLLAVIFLGFIFLYAMFLFYKSKNIRSFLFVNLSIFIGIISSLYVWAPFIIYASDTYQLSAGEGNSFYPFQFLFYSPYKFGLLFQGPKGELAQIIGYTQIFVLILSIILVFTKKINKRYKIAYIFWISLSITTIILMHPISAFIWRLVPSIQAMTTPYARTLLMTNFFIAIVASYFVLIFLKSNEKRKYVYILILLTISLTILNWGHRRVIPEITDLTLRKNAWKSVEITPHFLNSKYSQSALFWFPKKPQNHLEIVEGRGRVKEVSRTTTLHAYIIDAQTPVSIRENTLYFPGWILTSNNKQKEIVPGKQGEITTKLDKGLQYIQLYYEDIASYKFTKIISSTFFTIFLIGVFLQLKKERFR